VLTPQEADEVLGHVRDFARAGLCTVLLITHKFREVMAYADDVTVLRRGRQVHHCAVATPTRRGWRRPWWATRTRGRRAPAARARRNVRGPGDAAPRAGCRACR
jgi:ABC-type sugar transport system ATPase subunit